ncbi:MAG: hypothetical protein IT303_01585 [Dehalococcoidia bacterium]|nr:hypothetical protein [Dehalococcoidia bacterium]
MRIFPLLGVALFVASVGTACATGSAASPDPVPATPDAPAMTQMQVWSALRIHVVSLQHKADHTALVGCAATEATYHGAGIWHCGNWVLNERTLEIMRDDGSAANTGHVGGSHQ